MITAVRAFEIAHEVIAGKRCYDAPCDVTIERDSSAYTVTFSIPGAGGSPADSEPTRVLVDASSGSVRDIRNAREPERNARFSGMISAKRALEVGVATAREDRVEYDERWTTTVIMKGDKYQVTFPVPEEMRAASRRPSFAQQVWVDVRTGKVVGGLSAS